MTRLLARRAATVQRDERSAAALEAIAQPRVFRGPNVAIQDEIVEGLEAEFEKLRVTEGGLKLSLYNVSCVGGIELLGTPSADLDQVIAQAELVDLPRGSPAGRAVNKSSYEQAVAAGVQQLIVANTLSTMDAAGQLEYLRRSGLIDEQWRVLVEVHYYRDRDSTSTRTHKDTLGQTLFVNLNFLNDTPIAGPEFIVNPAPAPEHDEQVRDTLPAGYREDLAEVRRRLQTPEEFGIAQVPAKGVVAFVDELLHHKSPTMGHRVVSGPQVREYLASRQRMALVGHELAFEKYSRSARKMRTVEAKSRAWFDVIGAIRNDDRTFNRGELRELDPDRCVLKDTDLDALVEIGGRDDFAVASIPRTGGPGNSIVSDVKREGTQTLRRQMSQLLLQGAAPGAMEGRRAFFRTWVRAVPR